MTVQTIYASAAGARLDSNVWTGGGSDDTLALQAVLDTAKESGGLRLIMDGAALVRGLQVHSNTTIECLNQDCGFYLADQADSSLISNADKDLKVIRNRNIRLLGGTYNHNGQNQRHDRVASPDAGESVWTDPPHLFHSWVIALTFFGVENLVIRDVIIRNKRTFALLAANWRNVELQNLDLDTTEGGYQAYSNQDGFHFWGPGQFLTIRDVRGSSGDDFIALAPDENDQVSSITDVLIDHVVLREADAGIRLLSRANGRLDRVTIRNVTGSYKSFGFFINPYYPGNSGGNFGHIVFDTINLQNVAPNYDYTPPFLFKISGRVDSLTLKNITHAGTPDARPILDLSHVRWTWSEETKAREDDHTDIQSLVIDGLKIMDTIGHEQAEYIILNGKIGHFALRHAEAMNLSQTRSDGCLLCVKESADIGTLILHNVYTSGLGNAVRMEGGHVRLLQADQLLCDTLSGTALSFTGAKPDRVIADGLREIS